MIDIGTFIKAGIATPLYGWDRGVVKPILAHISREINVLLKRGVPQWTDRQDRSLDNALKGILERKNNPILTVSDLDKFLDEVLSRKRDEYTAEKITVNGRHKFINFYSSKAYELLCSNHPLVEPETDQKHKDVDIWVMQPGEGRIPMDVKVTVFPERLQSTVSLLRTEQRLRKYINNKRDLINWYYVHQGPYRWNWQNRLFIVCYNAQDQNHLELKADFSLMEQAVKNFFDYFDPCQLVAVSQLELLNTVTTSTKSGRYVQETALSDIIWNYRDYQIQDWEPRKVDPVNALQIEMF